MDKFDPNEVPLIEPGNPVWMTVRAWAEMNLVRLREQRENEATDLRKLDIALGSITTLKMLLELPATIKQERKRAPVTGDDFGIPAPPAMFDTEID